MIQPLSEQLPDSSTIYPSTKEFIGNKTAMLRNIDLSTMYPLTKEFIGNKTAMLRDIDLSTMYALTKEFIANQTDSTINLEPEKYIVIFYDNYNKFLTKISPYENEIYIGFPLFIIVYFVRMAFKLKKMMKIAIAEQETAADNQEKVQRINNIKKNSDKISVTLQKEKGIGFGFTPIVTEDNLLQVGNITRENIQLKQYDVIAQIGDTTVDWPVVNYFWENEYKPIMDAVPDNGRINLIVLRLKPSLAAAVPSLAAPVPNPQIQPTPEEIASEIKANPVNKENYDRRVNESDRIQVNLAKEPSGRLGLTFDITDEHILRVHTITRQDGLIKEGDVIVKIGDIDVTWPVVNYYWQNVYRPILTNLPLGQSIVLDILRLKPGEEKAAIVAETRVHFVA